MNIIKEVKIGKLIYIPDFDLVYEIPNMMMFKKSINDLN